MVATALNQPRREHRSTPIDLEPKSTYEVVTREKVEHFAEELKEIRHRVNTIFYLIIGSVLVDVVLKWI